MAAHIWSIVRSSSMNPSERRPHAPFSVEARSFVVGEHWDSPETFWASQICWCSGVSRSRSRNETATMRDPFFEWA